MAKFLLLMGTKLFTFICGGNILISGGSSYHRGSDAQENAFGEIYKSNMGNLGNWDVATMDQKLQPFLYLFSDFAHSRPM